MTAVDVLDELAALGITATADYACPVNANAAAFGLDDDIEIARGHGKIFTVGVMRDAAAGEFAVKSRDGQVPGRSLRRYEEKSAKCDGQKVKRVPCHGPLKIPSIHWIIAG